MNEQMRCKYGTGGVDKKNSEGYPDPTVYEALTNIKKEDKVFKPLVYICSPYAGDVERNIEKAKIYSRINDKLKMHESDHIKMYKKRL